MIGGKRKRDMSDSGTTLIAAGTAVEGDICFRGTLVIEGDVNGNIRAEEGCQAQVRVAESGQVNGEVCAPRVLINGHIEGSVDAAEHLELAPCARVRGDLYYASLEMAVGAEINGRLVHRPAESAKDAGGEPLRLAASNKVD